MTTVAAPTRYTPADVERLSDQTGKLYELVGGALVEKRVSKISNFIAGRVIVLLGTTYPPDRAYVFVEQPTYCFDKALREGRRPDVAMVWAERIPGGLDHEELYIPPDLVVEVVSPSNGFSEQQGRVNKYRRAGVGMVWLVDPDARAMHVYRGKGGSVSYLEGDDAVFENEPLLPGLSFKLSQILPPIVPAAKPA